MHEADRVVLEEAIFAANTAGMTDEKKKEFIAQCEEMRPISAAIDGLIQLIASPVSLEEVRSKVEEFAKLNAACIKQCSLKFKKNIAGDDLVPITCQLLSRYSPDELFKLLVLLDTYFSDRNSISELAYFGVTLVAACTFVLNEALHLQSDAPPLLMCEVLLSRKPPEVPPSVEVPLLHRLVALTIALIRVCYEFLKEACKQLASNVKDAVKPYSFTLFEQNRPKYVELAPFSTNPRSLKNN